MDELIDGWKDVRMYGWLNGWKDVRMYGWMDDEWMDELIDGCSVAEVDHN